MAWERYEEVGLESAAKSVDRSRSEGVPGGVEKGSRSTATAWGDADGVFSKSVPLKMAMAGVLVSLRTLSACSFWMRAAVSSSMAGVHSGARAMSDVLASLNRWT